MTMSSIGNAPHVVGAISADRGAGRWDGLPYHLLAGAGAILVFIGSYIPWATFYAGLVERNGVSGHGKYFIALAAVAVAASLASRVRGASVLGWLVPVAGVAIGALAVRDLRNLHLLVDEPAAAFYLPSVGDGLFVVIAGAALLTAASLIAPKATTTLRIRPTLVLLLVIAAGGLLIAGGYGEYYLHTASGGHAHHAQTLQMAHLLTGAGAAIVLALVSAGVRFLGAAKPLSALRPGDR